MEGGVNVFLVEYVGHWNPDSHYFTGQERVILMFGTRRATQLTDELTDEVRDICGQHVEGDGFIRSIEAIDLAAEETIMADIVHDRILSKNRLTAIETEIIEIKQTLDNLISAESLVRHLNTKWVNISQWLTGDQYYSMSTKLQSHQRLSESLRQHLQNRVPQELARERFEEHLPAVVAQLCQEYWIEPKQLFWAKTSLSGDRKKDRKFILASNEQEATFCLNARHLSAYGQPYSDPTPIYMLLESINAQ